MQGNIFFLLDIRTLSSLPSDLDPISIDLLRLSGHVTVAGSRYKPLQLDNVPAR